MTAADRRFALEIGAAFLGMVAVVAAVVLLIDGVEQARAVATGAIGADAWVRWVLARWPARVASTIPVAAALASVLVTARWTRNGWIDALESAGHPPRTLAVAAACVGLVGVLVGSCARELCASASIAIIAPMGAWITVERPPVTWAFRADSLDGDRIGHLDGGEIARGAILPFRASDASFADSSWTVAAADGVGIATLTAAMPDPDVWRALATGPGPDAPVAALWIARSTPAGAAWLAEDALRVAYGGLLSALAVYVARQERGGTVMVAIAVAWRVLQGAAIAAAAGGAWSIGAAVFVPFAAVIGAVAISRRSAGGRSSPTG